MYEYVESEESIQELGTEPEQVSPFIELLRSKPVPLLELFQYPRLLEEVERSRQQFGKELVHQRQLELDLVDCIVRPETLQQRGVVLPPHYPYLASQLFVALHEDYIKVLLEKITTEETGGLIVYMFELLKSEEVLNEANLGYLLKLVSDLLCNQYSSKMMPLFDVKAMGKHLVRHLYSPSVVEILLLVCGKERADSQEQDYHEMKLRIVDKMVDALGEASLPEAVEERIAGTTQFLSSMIEKSTFGERFQPLIEHFLLPSNVQAILHLFEDNTNNCGVTAAVINLLESFFGYYKPRAANHFGQNVDDPLMLPKPSEELLESFKFAIVKITGTVLQLKSELPGMFILQLSLSEMLLSYSKVWPDRAKDVVGRELCKWSMDLFESHPHNNILHNSLAPVVSVYIDNTPLDQLINDTGLGFLMFIRRNFQISPVKGELVCSSNSAADHSFQQHLILLLDRLFDQPLGDCDIDALIANKMSLSDWEQIKEQHAAVKKLQSEELCRNAAADAQQPLFDEEQVILKFDPKLSNGRTFGLFDNHTAADRQLNFLPNGSDVVLEHAIGMADAFFDCLEQADNDKDKPIPLFIQAVESEPATPVTLTPPQIIPAEVEIQADLTHQQQNEPLSIKTWYPQEQPLSSLEILSFFKDKFITVLGRLWRTIWH